MEKRSAGSGASSADLGPDLLEGLVGVGAEGGDGGDAHPNRLAPPCSCASPSRFSGCCGEPAGAVEDLDQAELLQVGAVLVALRHRERDENLCRKPQSPEEDYDQARLIAEEVRLANEATELAGKSSDGLAGGRGKKKPSGESPEGFKKCRHQQETNTQAANAVGMGRQRYERAGKVVEAARADPAWVLRAVPLHPAVCIWPSPAYALWGTGRRTNEGPP